MLFIHRDNTPLWNTEFTLLLFDQQSSLNPEKIRVNMWIEPLMAYLEKNGFTTEEQRKSE